MRMFLAGTLIGFGIGISIVAQSREHWVLNLALDLSAHTAKFLPAAVVFFLGPRWPLARRFLGLILPANTLKEIVATAFEILLGMFDFFRRHPRIADGLRNGLLSVLGLPMILFHMIHIAFEEAGLAAYFYFHNGSSSMCFAAGMPG